MSRCFFQFFYQSLLSSEAADDLRCHGSQALLEERTQCSHPGVGLLRGGLFCPVDAEVVLEGKPVASLRSRKTDALLGDVEFTPLLFRLLFL